MQERYDCRSTIVFASSRAIFLPNLGFGTFVWKCLNICQKFKLSFTSFLSYLRVLLSRRKFFCKFSCKIDSCQITIQGVRKHSNATSKEAMEELNPEVPENHDNLESTKVTKGSSTTPCVSLRLDASPRNVVESGCRQIYGDNGTFLRKLSATTILSTGMFLAYRVSLKKCLRF